MKMTQPSLSLAIEGKVVCRDFCVSDAYSEGLSQTFVDNFSNVVFVPGFVPEVALVVKQGKKMGIDAIFIGADGWGNAD